MKRKLKPIKTLKDAEDFSKSLNIPKLNVRRKSDQTLLIFKTLFDLTIITVKLQQKVDRMSKVLEGMKGSFQPMDLQN